MVFVEGDNTDITVTFALVFQIPRDLVRAQPKTVYKQPFYNAFSPACANAHYNNIININFEYIYLIVVRIG